jgi:uncharacterized protein YdeI (YjbR/CyaY-like superfamily)
MGKRDPRIDAYIAKAAPFAKPILENLRAAVHSTCPDCEETLKWSMPSFTYAGGILCTMASFKEHATFGFWKGSLVVDPGTNRTTEAMGQFGRITSVKDLPPRAKLAGYIRQAMKLNEEGVTVKRKVAAPSAPLAVPADLKAALARSARAKKAFEQFPPSHRREYVEWITEAKREETRKRRVATAVEWMAAGKSMNWKYER